jgi:hypothetical protein
MNDNNLTLTALLLGIGLAGAVYFLFKPPSTNIAPSPGESPPRVKVIGEFNGYYIVRWTDPSNHFQYFVLPSR